MQSVTDLWLQCWKVSWCQWNANCWLAKVNTALWYFNCQPLASSESSAVSSLGLCTPCQSLQVLGGFQKWKINKTKRQPNKNTGRPSVPLNRMNASIKQYKTAKSYFLPAQSALTCKTGFSFSPSLKGGSWCFWLRYPRWTINIQSEELLLV